MQVITFNPHNIFKIHVSCPSESYRNQGKCCRLDFCLYSLSKYSSQYPKLLVQKTVLCRAPCFLLFSCPFFSFSNTSPLLLFFFNCRQPLPIAAYCSDRSIDSCPRKLCITFLAIAFTKVSIRLCSSFIYFHIRLLFFPLRLPLLVMFRETFGGKTLPKGMTDIYSTTAPITV